MFDLQVLGKVALFNNGEEIPMISSRKTRALLAYLAMTDQVHTREHLSDLLFKRTSDPRGALRWALSRIRGMLGEGGSGVLIASGDVVQIDMHLIQLDLHLVLNTSAAGASDVADLIRCAETLSHNPLAHLRLSHTDAFNNWLELEVEKLQGRQNEVFKKISEVETASPASKQKWLRAWVRQAPESYEAAYALWECLNRLDQPSDAQLVADGFCAANGMTANIWARGPQLNTLPAFEQSQTVEYCRSPDGVRIAYACVGSGPPIVKTANWLNHLEFDWQSPIWGETFEALSARNTLIRYDERGNGMSDWDVPEISFDAFVDDLETVVDTLKLKRFPLLAMSQGCAVAIAYAVRHPERVSSLVLIGGYAAGWRIGMTPQEIEQRDAVLTLTRHGWGTANPAYRHIFSQTFMPGADAERLTWFDDFQRKTTSAENAVRFQEAFGDIDVRHLLKQVHVPTLVLHAKDDLRIALHHGQALADGIPNAKMVTLDSRNHIILGDEPAWKPFIHEISSFLAQQAEQG